MSHEVRSIFENFLSVITRNQCRRVAGDKELRDDQRGPNLTPIGENR